jgi:hypothetical protein
MVPHIPNKPIQLIWMSKVAQERLGLWVIAEDSFGIIELFWVSTHDYDGHFGLDQPLCRLEAYSRASTDNQCAAS